MQVHKRCALLGTQLGTVRVVLWFSELLRACTSRGLNPSSKRNPIRVDPRANTGEVFK